MALICYDVVFVRSSQSSSQTAVSSFGLNILLLVQESGRDRQSRLSVKGSKTRFPSFFSWPSPSPTADWLIQRYGAEAKAHPVGRLPSASPPVLLVQGCVPASKREREGEKVRGHGVQVGGGGFESKPRS